MVTGVFGFLRQTAIVSASSTKLVCMRVPMLQPTTARECKSRTAAQFTSTHFQQLLKEQSITCSMSRAGNVWDNSTMESFFSSLKTERTASKVYRSREQVRSDVFDYIERFYNPT